MYFDESIGENYLEWRDGQIILIDAPTGCGKTTFFENTYKNYALADGKRILYCTNRIVLRDQMLERQRMRIIEEEEKLQNASLWEYSRRREWGNFCITTYQAIETAIVTNNQKDCIFFSGFDILIADECHYFLSDSTFNTNTVQSFEFILRNYRNRRLIFMSASMGNFYSILINYLNQTAQNSFLAVNGMFSPFIYKRIEPDYSGYDFYWFYNYEELAEKIAEIPENEKALIFVSSISEGKTIKSMIENVIPQDDVYLFSSETVQTEYGFEVKEELIKNQQFNQRIFIATALIDNGINIVDETVSHIFTLQDNQESLIQTLGRRRIKIGEKVKVYLCARSRTYFSKRLSQLHYELKYIDQILNFWGYPYTDIAIASDFFDDDKMKVLKKFVGLWRFTNSYPRYFTNWWSLWRIRELCLEYENIIKEFDRCGSDAFILYQALWLGMDIQDMNGTVATSFGENFSNFFAAYVDVEMDVKEFNNFRAALMPILHLADKKKFPKIKQLSKWQRINEFLEENKIPFAIERIMKEKNSSKGRSYLVKKMEWGKADEQGEI